MKKRLGTILMVLCVLATARAAEAQRAMGANFGWWDIGADCDLADHSILLTYDQTGVRRRVVKQLAAMRASGIDTIRHMLWYSRDGQESWGMVQIVNGRLPWKYQRNLRTFLNDIKAAGFTHVSISFAPKGTLGPQFDEYNHAYFSENWAFVRQIRGIVKNAGIANTRFDLLNEGCPNIYSRNGSAVYDENLRVYISSMYSNYVDTYGNGDVTISCVSEDPKGLLALLTILRSTGRPMPTLFEAHAYMWWYDSLAEGIRAGLAQFDKTLQANGLNQPLAFSETYHDTAAVADGIAAYLGATVRPLTEVSSWPISTDSSCTNVPPPYKADEYLFLR